MTSTARSVQPADLPPGWNVLALDTVGSTNDEARMITGARSDHGGAPHGTMVMASRQTIGRGRRQRPWESPPGNLYCSVVLRPPCTPMVAGTLAFVVGVALAEAIETVAPTIATRLKWPNDVLVEGRKIAGILLESASRHDGMIDYVIAGTGVNIVSFPEDTEFPASSLRDEGAGPVTPEALLHAYAWALDRIYRTWCAEGFSAIRGLWINRAWRLGEVLTARLTSENVTGVFEDVDGSGNLILSVDDGQRRRIAAGDVFFGGA